ncbi:MAG: CDP-diacylglycerol--glycerol-3-phosphate 3-phosphatidyltransferase [Legionellaceae bacterium]|nr:CDP-diacylglycerol--glycerol-3-phosphate 3-phosphatidyltransferase [Legionellaceae bacterium]|tara:strand:- start:328 stop:903 length:576 start_codon:yes stop_codon:yes gene_type:complete
MPASKFRHLPNALTLFRILMIPLMIIAYYLPDAHFFATACFIIAAVTDWFDGFLARKLNVSSPLGAFLDPVADKLIVVAALIIVMPYIHYIAIPVVVIIGREIVISALREWMAEVGRRASVAVSYVAKIKTTLQMFGVGFLLAATPDKRLWIFYGSYVLIYLAAGLTLYTMIVYLRASWSQFFKPTEISSS